MSNRPEINVNKPKWRIEPKLSSEEVTAALNWVYSQFDLALEAESQDPTRVRTAECSDYSVFNQPLVFQDYFPLQQDIEETSLPQPVKHWLAQLLLANLKDLHQVRLPDLPEEKSRFDKPWLSFEQHLILQATGPMGSPKVGQHLENKVLTQEELIEQQARYAREKLQPILYPENIDVETLTDSEIVEVYQRVKQGAEKLRELLFFLQLETQAADLICQVAPALKNDLLDVIQTTLITAYFREPELGFGRIRRPVMRLDGTIPWGTYLDDWHVGNRVKGISTLNVDPQSAKQPDFYPVWLLTAAHELLHLLTNRYIEKWQKPKEGPNVQIEEAQCSLFRVIHEAISLAGEETVFRYLTERAHLSDLEKEILSSYSDFRFHYIRETANKQWIEVRRVFQGLANQEQFGSIVYSEGAKLAGAWKHRGWTLDEMELLIKTGTTMCIDDPQITTNSLYDLGGISVQRHLNPRTQQFDNRLQPNTYEYIFRKLKRLEKPS